MDREKVVHILKEIFQLYGLEVLQDRSRFESCLEDLLAGNTYASERMVFRHALDSTALWPLGNAQTITAEMAERAVAQLQKESRMMEEDARFIVQCIVAARGGNPNAVSPAVGQKMQEKPKAAGKATEKNQQASVRRTGMAANVPPPVSMACTLFGKGPGTVQMGADKFTFVPDRNASVGPVELFYQDIQKIGTGKAAPWASFLAAILIFTGLTLDNGMAMEAIPYVIGILAFGSLLGYFALWWLSGHYLKLSGATECRLWFQKRKERDQSEALFRNGRPLKRNAGALTMQLLCAAAALMAVICSIRQYGASPGDHGDDPYIPPIAADEGEEVQPVGPDVKPLEEESRGEDLPEEEMPEISIQCVGNTAGNLTNNGIAAEQDGKRYYWDYAEGTLYVQDGDQVSVLREFGSKGGFYNLNVVDNWIYYHGLSSPGDSIYRMRTDGTDWEEFADGTFACITATEEWVYCMERDTSYSGDNHSTLMKISVETGVPSVLSTCAPGSNSFALDGDWLYYTGYDELSGENGLYKIRTDGTSKTNLTNLADCYAGDVQVADGWVYYMPERNTLQRIRIDGSGKESRTTKDFYQYLMDACGIAYDSIHIWHFNIVDGWIYTGLISNETIDMYGAWNAIWRTRWDDLDAEIVAENGFFPNIVGDTLYFFVNEGFPPNWHLHTKPLESSYEGGN